MHIYKYDDIDLESFHLPVPGYSGMWCETEINECDPDPCSALFDCTDLINDYMCKINVPKLLAIILSSLVVFVVVVFVLRRVLNKIKYYKLSQSRYVCLVHCPVWSYCSINI